MGYFQFLLAGAVFAAGVYMTVTAIGAGFKTVAWIGKKLGVKLSDEV